MSLSRLSRCLFLTIVFFFLNIANSNNSTDSKTSKSFFNSCAGHLDSPTTDNGPAQFILGGSTTLNSSLLRDFESIPDEVLERYTKEINSVLNLKRKETHALVLAFRKSNSPQDRQKLFDGVKILVPISARHFLRHLKTEEQLEDYLQRGYLTLWATIPSIAKIPMKKIESYFYWVGVINGLRQFIFAQMRIQFRVNYSLTPVRFLAAQKLSFSEAILLFGDTPEALNRIAEHYGVAPEIAIKVANILELSKEVVQLPEETASGIDELEAIFEKLNDQDMNSYIGAMLATLTPREERVIRMRHFQDLTLEQIGDLWGISPERVRQIEMKAVRKMKHPARHRFKGKQVTLGDFTNVPPNPENSRAARPRLPKSFQDTKDAAKLERDQLTSAVIAQQREALVARMQIFEPRLLSVIKREGEIFGYKIKPEFNNQVIEIQEKFKRELDRYLLSVKGYPNSALKNLDDTLFIFLQTRSMVNLELFFSQLELHLQNKMRLIEQIQKAQKDNEEILEVETKAIGEIRKLEARIKEELNNIAPQVYKTKEAERRSIAQMLKDRESEYDVLKAKLEEEKVAPLKRALQATRDNPAE